MAVVTTVRFAHEFGALAHTLESLQTVDIRVLRDAGTDPEHNRSVFMFAGAPLETIESTLAADAGVANAHALPDYQGTHVFAIEFAEGTELLSPMVTSKGGFSLEARRSDPDTGVFGWRERWLLPNRDGLNEIWQAARNRGFAFEALTINEFDPEGSAISGMLTEEQRSTLRVAYEHGYFEEPRETSLEELSALLDLSSTAIGGRIRRGIKTLVEATVIEKPNRRY